MADAKVSTSNSKDKQKAARLRSPNYPAINLETAIQRAQQFWENEKRNAANVTVATTHWGFKRPTSQSIVTAAAVKSFGLFEDTGSGVDRKLKLSELALRIILDQRQTSPERDAAIKEAALKPTIHSKLWSRWGAQLPSDENLRHVLIFEYKFNENAVDSFIQEFKETIRFAKLSSSDTLSVVAEDKTPVRVGDYIQWTSQGVDQFGEPRPILGLSEDGQFVFTNGSLTGIPIEEVTKRDRPAGEQEYGGKSAKVGTIPTAVKRFSAKQGMNNEVFTLDEGEVILQWPSRMSAESYEDFKAWLDLIAKKAKRMADKGNGMEKVMQCKKCKKPFEVVGGHSNAKEVPKGVICPYCKEPNEISWPMDAALFSRAIPSQM
jgi:hypothetical protein